MTSTKIKMFFREEVLDETPRLLSLLNKPSELHKLCKIMHSNLEHYHQTELDFAESGVLQTATTFIVNQDISLNKCMMLLCLKNEGTMGFSNGDEIKLKSGHLYSFANYCPSFVIKPQNSSFSYIMFKSPVK
jgi:hypothetical protein